MNHHNFLVQVCFCFGELTLFSFPKDPAISGCSLFFLTSNTAAKMFRLIPLHLKDNCFMSMMLALQGD